MTRAWLARTAQRGHRDALLVHRGDGASLELLVVRVVLLGQGLPVPMDRARRVPKERGAHLIPAVALNVSLGHGAPLDHLVASLAQLALSLRRLWRSALHARMALQAILRHRSARPALRVRGVTLDLCCARFAKQAA